MKINLTNCKFVYDAHCLLHMRFEIPSNYLLREHRMSGSEQFLDGNNFRTKNEL